MVLFWLAFLAFVSLGQSLFYLLIHLFPFCFSLLSLPLMERETVDIYWMKLSVFILKITDMIKWSILNKSFLETPKPSAFYVIFTDWVHWPLAGQQSSDVPCSWWRMTTRTAVPLGAQSFWWGKPQALCSPCCRLKYKSMDKERTWLPNSVEQGGKRTQKGLACQGRGIVKKAFNHDSGPRGNWELLFTDTRPLRAE